MADVWGTFEPDPDYSPVAGTGLISPLSYMRNFTSGKSDVCVLAAAVRRGFKTVLFTEPVSRRSLALYFVLMTYQFYYGVLLRVLN